MVSTTKFNDRETVIRALLAIVSGDYTEVSETGTYHIKLAFDKDPKDAWTAISDAVCLIRKQAQDIIKLKTDLAEIQASLQEDTQPDDAELKQLEQEDQIRRMNNENQYMRGQLNVYEKLFAPCTAYDDEPCDKCEMSF